MFGLKISFFTFSLNDGTKFYHTAGADNRIESTETARGVR
jgi:hypothetical protein